MRTFRFRVHSANTPGKRTVAVAELSGFITAATQMQFDQCLDQLRSLGAYRVLLDFSEVEYINSSGIAAVLQLADNCREAGGAVLLGGVRKDVGRVMHLMGLTNVIPFYKDTPSGLAALDQVGQAAAAPAPAPKKGKGGKAAPPPVAAPPRPIGSPARILVITPGSSTFTGIMQRRLERAGHKMVLVNDCLEALKELRTTKPDMVLVEDEMPGSEEFVAKMKTSGESALVSVIKVYPKLTNLDSRVDFKIWEDEYIIEPFDMLELFALSEAELSRIPAARQARLQQLHFTFKSTDPSLRKAQDLARNVIFRVGLADATATPLFAAFNEAIDNAIRHGNRFNPDKRVDVVFLIDGEKITITVEDEGAGFDFKKYLEWVRTQDAVTRARMSRAEGRVGGLGIKLMHECTDELEYVGRGNKVRLVKKLPAPVAEVVAATPGGAVPAVPVAPEKVKAKKK